MICTNIFVYLFFELLLCMCIWWFNAMPTYLFNTWRVRYRYPDRWPRLKHIYMCVCVSVMIICAYMYVSTSHIGYVTPSLSDDPLFVASGPDAALSWIDWNCCICLSTSKKDMRCLQVVSVGSVAGAKSSLKGLGGLAGCQRGQKLLSWAHNRHTHTHPNKHKWFYPWQRSSAVAFRRGWHRQ